MGSAPPDMVSRPRTRDGPVSHPEATFTHFGALSVESYTAVCVPVDDCTVSEIVVV